MDVEISADPARIDVETAHRFLTESYWATGRTLDVVRRSIENSFCFGAYEGGRMVAFGRWVTDYATFAYLADVFVIPEFRGRGISKRLVRAMIDHPRMRGLGLLLRTRDAHELYRAFGFRSPADPGTMMVRPAGPEIVRARD